MGITGTFLGINCNYELDANSGICHISHTEGLGEQVVFDCKVFNFPYLGMGKDYLNDLGPQQKAVVF